MQKQSRVSFLFITLFTGVVFSFFTHQVLGVSITTMQGSDTLSASRGVINSNFSSLNSGKLETSEYFSTTTWAGGTEVINVLGSGTSTYLGGITTDSLRTNLPNCDTLDTNSSGTLICGTDASSAGAATSTIYTYTVGPSAKTANFTDLNLALHALPTTGGKIILLQGTITATSTITIPRSKVVIQGMGNSSIISCDGTTISPCIDVAGTTFSQITVRDIAIDNSNATNGGIGLDMSDVANMYVANLRISDFATGTRMFDNANATFYNHLENIQYFDTTSCIEIGGTQANDNQFSSIRCRPKGGQAGIGVYISRARSLKFDSLNVEPSSAGTITGIKIENNSRELTFNDVYLEANNIGVQVSTSTSANIINFFGGSLTSNNTDCSINGDTTCGDGNMRVAFHGVNKSGSFLNSLSRLTLPFNASSTSHLSGAVTLEGNLLGTTQTMTGLSTLAGANLSGVLNASSTAHISSNTSIGGLLNVSGIFNASSTAHISGNLTVGGNATSTALGLSGKLVNSFTGTSTFAGSVRLNIGRSQYGFAIIPSTDIGLTSAPVLNGAFVVDNSLNTKTPGLYISSDQAGVPSNPLAILRSSSGSYNQGLLWLLESSSNTGGAAFGLKVTGGNPDIEFDESDQTSPAGDYEIDGNNDLIRINGRNTANDSFDTIAWFARNDKGNTGASGELCIGCGFSYTQGGRIQVVATSTPGLPYLTFGTTAGATDILSVDRNGLLNLKKTLNASSTAHVTGASIFGSSVKISGVLSVGTTSPANQSKLAIDTEAAAGFLTIGNGTSMSEIGYTGSGSQSLAIRSATNNGLALGTNLTTRLQISSSGQIGIGTTSPTTKFETSIHSTGTSTLFSATPSTTQGSCLQMMKNNNPYRVFINAAENDLILEAGTCE